MPFIGFEMAHVIKCVSNTTHSAVLQELHGVDDVAMPVGNKVGYYTICQKS